jgi:hypothetical protein
MVHRNDRSDVRDVKHRAETAEQAASELRAKLLKEQVRARASKTAAYRHGLRVGRKEARAIQAAAGDTYNSGYDDGENAGYATALGGFDSWNNGAWYIVKVNSSGDTAAPYEVQTRVPMNPCVWMYLTNEQIYTGNYAC